MKISNQYPICCCCSVAKSCPTLCNLRLQPSRLLCPWDFPGKNTGVGCYFPLQGIFWIQESNPCFLHWQAIFLPLSHKGSSIFSLWKLQKEEKTKPKGNKRRGEKKEIEKRNRKTEWTIIKQKRITENKIKQKFFLKSKKIRKLQLDCSRQGKERTLKLLK